MSNMTPFEIRLELLKMAKEMLEQDYYAQREIISNDWQMKIETARLNQTEVPNHPGFPDYPNQDDIIRKAKSLNSFVSNG